MNVIRMARIGVLALADVAALLAVRPNPSRLGRELLAPHAWVQRAGADGVAIELADAGLWCAAAWLALGLLACLGGTLPGAAGQCARRIARATLPMAVYRLAVGAAGLGLFFAPLAAGAAAPHPAPSGGTPPARSHGAPSGSSGGVSPEWPTDSPVPAPTWPTAGDPFTRGPARHPARHHSPQHHSPQPQSPQPQSPQPQSPPDHPPQRPAAADQAGRAVIVRTDDSLWRIAAANLPASASAARIARSWPRWYAINRAVIGPDPAFLVPGQTLHAPPPASEGRP